MPTVLLANTEKSIKEEFLTPHSSFVKPFIEEMKALDKNTSKSCLRSESWNNFLN